MGIKEIVHRLERAYDIYDVDPDEDVAAYFASADSEQMVQMFDALRDEVRRDDCFPLLVKRKEDYAFYIMRNPTDERSMAWLAPVLVLATIITTVWAGAFFSHGYDVTLGRAVAADFPSVTYFLKGAAQFAVPLLFIVALHEFVQMAIARRHDVRTSLPYFVPLPPGIGFIGTLGAVTNLKDPVPDRRALLQIGLWGPVAGFLASALVLLVGLAMSTQQAVTPAVQTIEIGEPLLFTLLSTVVSMPPGAELHPAAIAGWVGLFLTAITLLPGATFDGGMVARAFLGRDARWLAYVAVLVLAGLGFLWWPWWAVAAVIAVSGFVHAQPLNELRPLDAQSWVYAAVALVVLVLSFVPAPLA